MVLNQIQSVTYFVLSSWKILKNLNHFLFLKRTYQHILIETYTIQIVFFCWSSNYSHRTSFLIAQFCSSILWKRSAFWTTCRGLKFSALSHAFSNFAFYLLFSFFLYLSHSCFSFSAFILFLCLCLFLVFV